jgi:hypothetical protein
MLESCEISIYGGALNLGRVGQLSGGGDLKSISHYWGLSRRRQYKHVSAKIVEPLRPAAQIVPLYAIE